MGQQPQDQSGISATPGEGLGTHMTFQAWDESSDEQGPSPSQDLLLQHSCRHGGAITRGARCCAAGTESTTNSSVPVHQAQRLDDHLNNHIGKSSCPVAATTDFVRAIALMAKGLEI